MSKRRFNIEKTIAEIVNHTTFTDYYNRLRLLAKTMFEWCNVPDKINTRFIEDTLYHYGKCCFYDDPTFGLMVARCNTSNVMNIYNEPTDVHTYSTDPHYKTQTLKIGKECVLIRNNVEMIPTDFTIQQFAYRLYEAQRSIDVNIGNQKFPALILCNQNQLFSFKKVFQDVQANEPVIFADKNMNPEAIKSINMEIPFVADKLTIQKHEIWNECMSFLGLNNANTDKKERLITDEVNSNNELIEMMSQVMLAERQRACDEINKLFGTNIGVKLRNYIAKEEKDEIDEPRVNGGDIDE